MLENGAEVNAKDENKNTALDRLCATSGNAKAAELLITAGARIIHKIDKDQGHSITSLMSAALNGHRDLCRDLMDKWGCDPRIETDRGGSARSFSESQGHKEVAEMISQRIAAMEVANK